ncbi:hypothetical protein VU12_10590 [Desulfobulbus sp. US4]|nr:hypothetical protein [Desulfobulbus sp. US4]
MIGADYGSLNSFVNACRNNRSELNAGSVLGKMYKVEVLRKIASNLGVDISDASGASRNVTYSTADIIAKKSHVDVIGDTLSKHDHLRLFPIVTYYQIPSSGNTFSSFYNFEKVLQKKDVILTDGYHQFFNGLTKPPPHNCKLESITSFEKDNYFSLLCSCSRALLNPSEKHIGYENLFLCRIPVLIRVFFKLGLVEFSMPCYSESIAKDFGYEHQAPKRYQQAFESAYSVLRNITDAQLPGIRYAELPSWFEQEYSAEDMGWKILPHDDADFDLTQNCIPLKDILDGFMSSLDSNCTLMGKSHKLEGVDLYHVFRALQTESHTHTMAQRVSFGDRGGTLVLTLFFGAKTAQYYPIILLEKTPTDTMLDNLREAVSSLRDAKISNKYTINSLLVEAT